MRSGPVKPTFVGIIALVILWSVSGVSPSPGQVALSVYERFYPRTWSCGDAIVTDHGPLSAYDRIVVEIANVDLSIDDDYEYVLCDLPREDLIFGLAVPVSERTAELRDPVQRVKSSDVGRINVGLSILDDRGQSIFLHKSRLDDEWMWSSGATSPESAAFVYWFTSNLTPDRARTYRLELSVSPAVQEDPVEARLRATGGGWK